jgi:hypothetical protein
MMPRKPKQPSFDLKIEGLSDGREIRPKTFVSDFGGEVLPVVQDPSPAKVMKSAQEVKNEINRAKRAVARTILENTGILPKPPKPPAPKSNQAMISDDTGPRLMLTWPPGKKRLRRL